MPNDSQCLHALKWLAKRVSRRGRRIQHQLRLAVGEDISRSVRLRLLWMWKLHPPGPIGTLRQCDDDRKCCCGCLRMVLTSKVDGEHSRDESRQSTHFMQKSNKSSTKVQETACEKTCQRARQRRNSHATVAVGVVDLLQPLSLAEDLNSEPHLLTHQGFSTTTAANLGFQKPYVPAGQTEQTPEMASTRR